MSLYQLLGYKISIKEKEEYDSSSVDKLDIIVDSSIKAFRNSTHYGNEFLSRGDIHPKYIKSIDVRIEEYLKMNRHLLTFSVMNYQEI